MPQVRNPDFNKGLRDEVSRLRDELRLERRNRTCRKCGEATNTSRARMRLRRAN